MRTIELGAAFVAGLLAVSAPTTVQADVILLEADIAAVRFVSKNESKMSQEDRAIWLSISNIGRNLLTRETSAVVISVNDDGTWSFRVDGQTTTSRHSPQGASADAMNVESMLSTEKVRRVLAAIRAPYVSASNDAIAQVYQSKLQQVRDGVAASIFDAGEEEELLATIGEQMSTASADVRAEIRRNDELRQLALRAESLGRQPINQRELLKQFASGGNFDRATAIAPGELPEEWMTAAKFRNYTVDGKKITIAEIPASSGTFLVECKENSEGCLIANDDAIKRAVYLKSAAKMEF